MQARGLVATGAWRVAGAAVHVGCDGLADDATGDQILIAQRLYAEVEDDVEVDPVGEVTLAGFRRPVAAFNVVGVRETAATPYLSQRGGRSAPRCYDDGPA